MSLPLQVLLLLLQPPICTLEVWATFFFYVLFGYIHENRTDERNHVSSCHTAASPFFQQGLNLLRFKSREPSPLKLSNHLIWLNHSKYAEANWLQAMTNFCLQLPLFLSVLEYLLFPTVITCFFRNESLPLNLSQKTILVMHILSTFRCSEPQCSRDRSIIK